MAVNLEFPYRVIKFFIPVFRCEEADTHVFLERTPVSTDATIVCDDWLEDTRIIMGEMFEGRVKNDVATLVANQVLIIGRNQKVFSFAETSCPTILMKEEYLSLIRVAVKMITNRVNSKFAVTYLQS